MEVTLDINMQSMYAGWLKSVNPDQFMSWFVGFTQVACNLIDTEVLWDCCSCLYENLYSFARIYQTVHRDSLN